MWILGTHGLRRGQASPRMTPGSICWRQTTRELESDASSFDHSGLFRSLVAGGGDYIWTGPCVRAGALPLPPCSHHHDRRHRHQPRRGGAHHRRTAFPRLGSAGRRRTQRHRRRPRQRLNRRPPAAPDGYTLLLASASAFTVLPIRHEHAPTVVGRDLQPIAFLGELPMAYAVSAKLGVRSVKDLIELSKREPDKIFYAANATGTLPHMAGEHFKSRAGASLTFVPYRGTADALAGVLSGHINAIVENDPDLGRNNSIGRPCPAGVLVQRPAAEFPGCADGRRDDAEVDCHRLRSRMGACRRIRLRLSRASHADVRRIFDKPDVRQRLIDWATILPACRRPTRPVHPAGTGAMSPVVRSILAQAAACESRDKSR